MCPSAVARCVFPTGVGKTHVAQALGHLTVRHGAETRFLKTSRALAHLAGGHADLTWDKRLRELCRPAVLILDDFGMRELTATQADDLHELITERAGRSLILTSNRAPAKAHNPPLPCTAGLALSYVVTVDSVSPGSACIGWSCNDPTARVRCYQLHGEISAGN
jgi:hypothetical protein